MKSTEYTFHKNQICKSFDQSWECILILKKPRLGSNVVTIHGKCKHKGCRKYKFVALTANVKKATGAPTFNVFFNQRELIHPISLIRQFRGADRVDEKVKLRESLPATYLKNALNDMNEMDEETYANGKKSTVPSDCVTQKMRSEVMLEQDLDRDHFQDMVKLQKATQDSPYIQKVISPYAVYMHSKEQYETLVLAHNRKKPGTEVVGRLDATAGVAYVTPETSTHQIMYYPLVLSIKMDESDRFHTLFPVTEELNTGHGVSDISGWLNDFNEKFIAHNSRIHPVMDRIISDFSYANFHGVLHSFQSMRLQ